MQHTKLRVLCAVGAMALPLLMTTTAEAGARRPGVAGSLLIDDQDDIWIFPQLTLDYRNLIGLSYGANAGSGNALMTLGDESFAFGVALHRGDVQSPHAVDEIGALGGPASLFGAPFTIGPATVFDLLLGFDVGGGDLGLRLGFGSGAQSVSAGGSDTGESDTFFMGEVGFGSGTRGQDTRLDLSGALLVDMASAQVAGMDTSSGTAVGFSALARVYFPIDATLDLGVLGNARVLSNSVVFDEMLPGSPSDSSLDLGIGGGVGPALRLGRATVAGYGIVNLDIGSDDPDSEFDGDESSRHAIVVPGVHMAVEVPLNDWFVVRSGAEYRYVISGTSDDDNNGPSERTGSFGWNAGVGVIIDDFRFDGSLQHGFVTGGPNFIGGENDAGFLGIASLTYSFDAARSAAAAPVEEPPPPPPVAAPEPEPAPAPPPPEPAPTPPTPAPTGWGTAAPAPTAAPAAP